MKFKSLRSDWLKRHSNCIRNFSATSLRRLTGCYASVCTLWVLVAILSSNSWADEPEKMSALKWYKEVYWPYWEDSAQFNLMEVKPLFSKNFSAYSGVTDSFHGDFPPPGAASMIKQFREKGWLGDELLGAKSRRINERTYVIEATIRNSFKTSPKSTFCSWYLLEESGETWSIASQAWLDCNDEE
jgi:hypothetical protein